jgi:hypothetical protein
MLQKRGLLAEIDLVLINGRISDRTQKLSGKPSTTMPRCVIASASRDEELCEVAGSESAPPGSASGCRTTTKVQMPRERSNTGVGHPFLNLLIDK